MRISRIFKFRIAGYKLAIASYNVRIVGYKFLIWTFLLAIVRLYLGKAIGLKNGI